LLHHDAARDVYHHGDIVFSVQAMHQGAERWFELVVHVCDLTEENSIEAMASALGTNYYQMRLFPQSVFFGLKSDPAILVLICRLNGPVPATQEVLALLKRFDEQISALKQALSAQA
ncbi:MAG: hypothetical protein RIR70_1071, partial [Pseudomonadota bacterium]